MKIRRNAKCTCPSGKKYKDCCGKPTKTVFEITNKKVTDNILSIEQQKELYEYYKVKNINLELTEDIKSELFGRNNFAFYNINGEVQFCRVTVTELQNIIDQFINSCKILNTSIIISETENFNVHQSGSDYIFSGKRKDLYDILNSMESLLNQVLLLKSLI